MATLTEFGDFITRHWGDVIALYLIHLAIILIVFSILKPQMADVQHVGEGLLLAGVGMLKLRYNPPEPPK